MHHHFPGKPPAARRSQRGRQWGACLGRPLVVGHIVLMILAAGGVGMLRGEQPPATDPLPPPPNPSKVRPLPEASVDRLDDGRLRIGNVIIDKHKRCLTIPAEVNMAREVVEYFLVTATGKIHESVLRTDVAPYHVHIAMLLLGAKGAAESDLIKFQDPKSDLPGDTIEIGVSWKSGQETIEKRAEDLIESLAGKQAMARGFWTYNGSRLVDGSFVAQNEGSLVSLITDQGALANNPRSGRDNDENWFANATVVPAVKTPVEVTFRLVPPTTAGAPPPAASDVSDTRIIKTPEKP